MCTDDFNFLCRTCGLEYWTLIGSKQFVMSQNPACRCTDQIEGEHRETLPLQQMINIQVK